MGKRILYVTLLLLAVAIMVLAGCASDNKVVSGTGTVKYINLEGGFYGIVGDDGRHYDPINLGQEFRQDGLRVRFEAKIREDVASIHMWGTIIEIAEIKRLT